MVDTISMEDIGATRNRSLQRRLGFHSPSYRSSNNKLEEYNIAMKRMTRNPYEYHHDLDSSREKKEEWEENKDVWDARRCNLLYRDGFDNN